MREIKFRAWQKEHKTMWYNGGHIDLSLHLEGGLFTPDSYYSCDFEKEFVLMQYTGLHDKNGKEIYEGDTCAVVSISYGKRIGEVKFHRGCFIISFGEQADGYNSDMLYVPLKVEVVGNIYENPELMEAK